MVKIGIIGTGVMGSYHIRALSELEDVESIAISDVDREAVGKIARRFNINKFYYNHKKLLDEEELDGVIIAVPPKFHKQVALDCIEKGVNILVEKPITHNVEDAEEIIMKARDKGIVFTVGHIERFNPVVTQIKKFVEEGLIGKVYLINTVRVGPFPKRLYGLWEGVLVDLAVHDVDIINYLGGNIEQIYSQLIFSGNQEIYANCLFNLKEGVKASSEFSWVSPKKTRTIKVFGEKGMLKGDYQNQTVYLYENSDESGEGRALVEGRISEGKVIKYLIRKEEPLKIELRCFIDSIKRKREVLVKPEEAKDALNVALGILKSGTENRIVNNRLNL